MSAFIAHSVPARVTSSFQISSITPTGVSRRDPVVITPIIGLKNSKKLTNSPKTAQQVGDWWGSEPGTLSLCPHRIDIFEWNDYINTVSLEVVTGTPVKMYTSVGLCLVPTGEKCHLLNKVEDRIQTSTGRFWQCCNWVPLLLGAPSFLLFRKRAIREIWWIS